MAEGSAIDWTHDTFNPWWGCQKVSPGCERCYAETLSTRYGHSIWGPPKTTSRRLMSDAYWKKPLTWNRKAQAAGARRRVFCGSMCDVFEVHPDLVEPRARLWPLIEATPDLDWLLLTKRPENIDRMLPQAWGSSMDFPTNIWLGTSAENQETLDLRWPALEGVGRRRGVRILFLSLEPLLEAIDLDITRVRYESGDWTRGVDWVIAGGESGPGCRQMAHEWVIGIRDHCKKHDVPFFFKQWGGHPHKRAGDKAQIHGRLWHQFPAELLPEGELPPSDWKQLSFL